MDTDLKFLPPDLRVQSLSAYEIVLPYTAVLQAIAMLRAQNIAALAWEGWIRTPDGHVGHAPAYQGTMSIEQGADEPWSVYVQRSLDVCAHTIHLDYTRWLEQEHPYSPNVLYFCVTCAPPDEAAGHGKLPAATAASEPAAAEHGAGADA